MLLCWPQDYVGIGHHQLHILCDLLFVLALPVQAHLSSSKQFKVSKGWVCGRQTRSITQ